VSEAPLPSPAFTSWPTFPFEGELRVKKLDDPVDVEPSRHGEDPAECTACCAPDSAYVWVSERWRVRSLDQPTGLPMVLILESRSHLDLGDLPNMLAAELGVLTVRLERAIRSLDGVARVHVNRWGDGSAHLHVWFLARPYGRLQLRGTFLSLWDDILPRIPESQWRDNLALVAEWLAEFGGRALAEPPRIDWKAPAVFAPVEAVADEDEGEDAPADDDRTAASIAGAEIAEHHGSEVEGVERITAETDLAESRAVESPGVESQDAEPAEADAGPAEAVAVPGQRKAVDSDGARVWGAGDANGGRRSNIGDAAGSPDSVADAAGGGAAGGGADGVDAATPAGAGKIAVGAGDGAGGDSVAAEAGGEADAQADGEPAEAGDLSADPGGENGAKAGAGAATGSGADAASEAVAVAGAKNRVRGRRGRGRGWR
jgi:hypothetical protein